MAAAIFFFNFSVAFETNFCEKRLKRNNDATSASDILTDGQAEKHAGTYVHLSSWHFIGGVHRGNPVKHRPITFTMMCCIFSCHICVFSSLSLQ